MRLLALLTLLLVRKSHLLHLPLKILLLQLRHPILSHLRLHIPPFSLTLDAELLRIFDKLCDILRIDFLVLGRVRRVFYLLGRVHNILFNKL